MTVGKVYLTGAGPGDPRLISLRAMQAIAEADVIVYDRLVHPQLLRFARADAKRVYAGKACGRHAMSQDAIQESLLHHARAGKVVTRLKGGDPFVYGRGAEEALALRKAGIPFEVIPGITSAVAAPASVGIPVTCRGVAANFAVVVGHDPTEVNWSVMAQLDTLVILMGLRAAAEIQACLLAAGKAPTTPVAVIANGTNVQQTLVSGTLQELGDMASGVDRRMPATIVVGEVVALATELGAEQRIDLPAVELPAWASADALESAAMDASALPAAPPLQVEAELRQRIAELEQKLRDKEAVERAKRILIRKLNVTEEDAYHTLRRRAMNLRIPVGEVARSVLVTAELGIAMDAPG